MPAPEQVLLGLGIFFLILWTPLVVAFFVGKLRSRQDAGAHAHAFRSGHST